MRFAFLVPRLIKLAACFAGSGVAFSVPFFERLPFKSVVPFVLQMLLGWALLLAAVYQIVQAVREAIAHKANEKNAAF